jgi:hypothetical protein
MARQIAKHAERRDCDMLQRILRRDQMKEEFVTCFGEPESQTKNRETEVSDLLLLDQEIVCTMFDK